MYLFLRKKLYNCLKQTQKSKKLKLFNTWNIFITANNAYLLSNSEFTDRCTGLLKYLLTFMNFKPFTSFKDCIFSILCLSGCVFASLTVVCCRRLSGPLWSLWAGAGRLHASWPHCWRCTAAALLGLLCPPDPELCYSCLSVPRCQSAAQTWSYYTGGERGEGREGYKEKILRVNNTDPCVLCMFGSTCTWL